MRVMKERARSVRGMFAISLVLQQVETALSSDFSTDFRANKLITYKSEPDGLTKPTLQCSLLPTYNQEVKNIS